MRRQRGDLLKFLPGLRTKPTRYLRLQPHRLQPNRERTYLAPAVAVAHQFLAFRRLRFVFRLDLENDLSLLVSGRQMTIPFDPRSVIEQAFHRSKMVATLKMKRLFFQPKGDT